MSLLTDKQYTILGSINRFGVITISQLSNFLNGEISHVTVYNTKKKLLDMGFITEDKVGYDGVLSIRPSGVDYLGSDLTKFTKINYSLLNHNLLCNDAILTSIYLATKGNFDFSFLTERELRSNFIKNNFTLEQKKDTKLIKLIPDRIPDFVCYIGDECIAYEVELSQKSKRRYQDKFKRYYDECLNGDYQKVRYLCNNNTIKEAVESNAKAVHLPHEYLQVELLRRFLKIGNPKK